MSNRSDVLAAARKDSRTADPLAATERPRRVRLAKAMLEMGRAMEVQTPAAEGQQFHARTCKLSNDDEARLEMLKRRLGGQGVRIKKGQLLRAALWVLADFDDGRLREAVQALDNGHRIPPGDLSN